MAAENGLLTLLVALIGGGCTLLAARWSRIRPAPTQETEDEKDEELQVSPRIWDQLNGRIGALETEVAEVRREANAAAHAYTEKLRESSDQIVGLERLLRQAMRIVRRANRRLAARNEVPEEIPRELVPYSID
ncbi:hypothetical protein [Streptomyces sp. NPDC055607]